MRAVGLSIVALLLVGCWLPLPEPVLPHIPYHLPPGVTPEQLCGCVLFEQEGELEDLALGMCWCQETGLRVWM